MSRHKVDNVSESTPGAGVTIDTLKFGTNSPIDSLITYQHRRTAVLSDYLERNKVINSKDYLIADGVANDYGKFVDMQTDAGATGTLDLFPGTAKIDAGGNLNIPQFIRPRRGTMLKPALGTNLNFQGGRDEVTFQWIDLSLGGTVSHNGNRSVKWHIPQNYGVKGDDANADYLPLYWLLNSIPDWSNIWFGPLMKMQLDYLVMQTGRTGLTLWTEGWPLELYGGNDGTMFRWRGPAGGIMMGFYNSSFITVRGFMWDGLTASVGLDFDNIMVSTVNGSNAITSDIQNIDAPTGAGNGPAIFTSLPPNFPIKISGAGPAGAVLSTTLNPAPANGTHATIAVNASASQTGFGAAALSVGPGALQPINKITTQCFVARNRFVGGAGNRVWSCLRISKTALSNCECFLIRENYFCGNGNTVRGYILPSSGDLVSTQRAIFGGSPFTQVTPAGVAMALGTNDLQGGAVDWAHPSWNGEPLLIARAGVPFPGGALPPGGPNNGPANLVGFVQYVDARHIKIVNAVGAAINAGSAIPTAGFPVGFMVGKACGTGLEVGYSQEPHHQVLENNMYFSLEIGSNLMGGSHHEWMGQYTDNEVNKVMGNRQACPSSSYGINSENSRQHLFIQPTARYTERGARCAMLYTAPGTGYITIFGAAGAILLEDSQLENQLGPGQAAFDLHAAAGQVLISHRNDYLLTSPVTLADSLKMLGWQTLSSNVYVESKDDAYAGAPSEITYCADIYQNARKIHLGPQVFLSLSGNLPAVGDWHPNGNEAVPVSGAGDADHSRKFSWMVRHPDAVSRLHSAPQMHQKKVNFGAPANLAAGALQVLGDVALAGVLVGDSVEVGLTQELGGSSIYGRVIANDSVRLYQYNNTGGALNFQNNPDYYITVTHFDTF